MDINKLTHFRAVAETENLRKAAQLLALSPGALSKSLRVFQEELGAKLIEPHGRGIVLTSKGKELYHASHRVIEEVNLLSAAVHSSSESINRLGTYEVFSSRFLADFVREEKIKQIECKELGPGEIEESLLRREIDFGLTLAPFPHKDLEHLKIGKLNMKTFCLRESRFLGSPLESLEYAVPMTSLGPNPMKTLAIDHWPENLPRKINFKFQMLETALQTTSSDLSVIYCPDMVVGQYNERLLKKHQLTEHSYKKANKALDIYLVKRNDTEENSFSKKLVKFTRLTLRG